MMKEKNTASDAIQDELLKEDINKLRHEIERLAWLLTLRKIEARFPPVHKAVNGMERLWQTGENLAHEAKQAASRCRHCALTAEGILAAVSGGYLLYYIWDMLNRPTRGKRP